jgi:hypothetical protein
LSTFCPWTLGANGDSYRRFVTNATEVQAAWKASAASGDIEYVGRPEQVELTVDQVDGAVVDKGNEMALKALPRGESTTFYEIGDLVIIEVKGQGGKEAYIDWAQQYDGVNQGTITMTQKGGVFSAGSVLATGVHGELNFTRAIARVSDKRVDYSAAKKKPAQMSGVKSPFKPRGKVG